MTASDRDCVKTHECHVAVGERYYYCSTLRKVWCYEYYCGNFIPVVWKNSTASRSFYTGWTQTRPSRIPISTCFFSESPRKTLVVKTFAYLPSALDSFYLPPEISINLKYLPQNFDAHQYPDLNYVYSFS